MTAMPHPMNPVTNESFVAVCILKKPVIWGKKAVKYIFLLVLKKDSTDNLSILHESLASLVMDKNALSRLEKNPCTAQLQKILGSYMEEAKDNDLDTLFS